MEEFCGTFSASLDGGQKKGPLHYLYLARIQWRDLVTLWF